MSKGDKIRKTSDPEKYAKGWEKAFGGCKRLPDIKIGGGLGGERIAACSCGWRSQGLGNYSNIQHSELARWFEEHKECGE